MVRDEPGSSLGYSARMASSLSRCLAVALLASVVACSGGRSPPGQGDRRLDTGGWGDDAAGDSADGVGEPDGAADGEGDAAGGDGDGDGDGDEAPDGDDYVPGDAAGGDGDAGDGDEVPSPGDADVTSFLYPLERTHSPVTSAIAARLRGIAAVAPSLNDDMFMKVGDSITESFAVMSCFAGPPESIVLDGRDDLWPAIDHFRAADVAGPSPCTESWCQDATTAFNRDAFTAEGGSTASWPLEGSPTWFARELDAIAPRYALVQFGTNDSTLITSATTREGFDVFFTRMTALVDQLIGAGVIPLLYTIPPYAAPRNGYHNPPTMNLIVRALAQGRSIPLIDFHRAVASLSDWGSWDGVHPRVEYGGCVFTSAGLLHGYNVRNLITMQALARMVEVVSHGATELDVSTGAFGGQGTAVHPYAIGAPPFAHMHDTRSGHDSLAAYCGLTGRNGPDIHYTFTLAAGLRLRVLALDAGANDVRVSLLTEGPSATCLGTDRLGLHVTLGPGAYRVIIDSPAAPSDGEGPGEYAVIVTACEANDPSCE